MTDYILQLHVLSEYLREGGHGASFLFSFSMVG